MKRRSLWPALLFCLLGSNGGRAAADASGPAAVTAIAHAPLRVAISSVAPFVLPQLQAPEGFSINGWDELARRMHLDFIWVTLPALAGLLSAVQLAHGDVQAIVYDALTFSTEPRSAPTACLPWAAHCANPPTKRFSRCWRTALTSRSIANGSRPPDSGVLMSDDHCTLRPIPVIHPVDACRALAVNGVPSLGQCQKRRLFRMTCSERPSASRV